MVPGEVCVPAGSTWVHVSPLMSSPQQSSSPDPHQLVCHTAGGLFHPACLLALEAMTFSSLCQVLGQLPASQAFLPPSRGHGFVVHLFSTSTEGLGLLVLGTLSRTPFHTDTEPPSPIDWTVRAVTAGEGSAQNRLSLRAFTQEPGCGVTRCPCASPHMASTEVFLPSTGSEMRCHRI